MNVSDPTRARELVSVDPSVERPDELIDAIARTRALFTGHFSLHRGTHTTAALRFRALGRDQDALGMIGRLVVASASWSWDGAKILSPESAGFFLGAALARERRLEHAVVQTDLRRVPTSRLVTGTIEPADRVVIANDLVSTGASLEPMRQLVEQRGAQLLGIALFGVVGVAEFTEYCHRRRARHASLILARWQPLAPGPESCPGCREGQPILPIAEFS